MRFSSAVVLRWSSLRTHMCHKVTIEKIYNVFTDIAVNKQCSLRTLSEQKAATIGAELN